MKHFLTLALFACSLVGYTQVSASFNPDYNGDGYVGVDDILGVLSHYDTAWEADAAQNMVVDSLETIITEVSSVNDSLQSELDYALSNGCIPPEYPLYASWWDAEAAISWQQNLIEALTQINGLIPGYMPYCQLASWQSPLNLDCFTNPETQEQMCFWMDVVYDSNQVINDLNYYLNMQEEYGYAVPSSSCLLQIRQSPTTPFSCEDWNFSAYGGGIAETGTLEMPSGSGALVVRSGGIENTRNIFIPGTFTHAFINGIGGIDNQYNIHFNPNTTTLVGSVGGINNNANFIEDTSL